MNKRHLPRWLVVLILLVLFAVAALALSSLSDMRRTNDALFGTALNQLDATRTVVTK